ncbi:YtxH domain-containing protein [Cupriavidus sp. AU9028]|uniref:YtxH domain-containing protein n=1 Tax=Cupriavidus sp. AU9028 TaxID=2871157 RepID=UPI001C977FF4|nr:YtxH domain-containing protein [Cupriavidus sp. AU9028]MBY4897302.1 YtxH domain-containing protein [Cupriavidus sp. AU9028]
MHIGTRDLVDFAVAAAAGAALMYLFDPDQGERRRAQLRDKAAARRREVSDYAQTQANRTLDKARGLKEKISSRAGQQGDEATSGDALPEGSGAEMIDQPALSSDTANLGTESR